MNTANPFQIPSCLQRADLQQRRRERFKKAVVASVAAFAALLVVLLIEGCMTEHTKTATAAADAVGKNLPGQVAVVESKPASTLPPTPVTPPPVAVVALNKAVSRRPESVYVVEPGDTLSRIAKFHRTTVKALKAVNGLNNDSLAVGAKLKLPMA